jgi:cytochrome oxidase Cu insertion factor (SCO1/SenC/PrrC family)
VAALASLFLLPLIVSFVLYYATDWRPAGSTIHGELIAPPRTLPALSFEGTKAEPANANLFADKWTLVYVGQGECGEACRRSLLVMRQTRLSLNNEMTRVGRVFLATGHCCDQDFLKREHPGLIVIDAAQPRVQTLLGSFPTSERDYSLFVVDPLGNLMMRYDARQNPKGLLEDLKKLLKLSHIG